MYVSFFLFHVVGHFLSSRSSELFIFDVASPIAFFVCLLSVCFFFLASSPILNTLSISVVAVCDIVYMLFKPLPKICLKPRDTESGVLAHSASGSRMFWTWKLDSSNNFAPRIGDPNLEHPLSPLAGPFLNLVQPLGFSVAFADVRGDGDDIPHSPRWPRQLIQPD